MAAGAPARGKSSLVFRSSRALLRGRLQVDATLMWLRQVLVCWWHTPSCQLIPPSKSIARLLIRAMRQARLAM